MKQNNAPRKAGYTGPEYAHKRRFMSYWHQISLILGLEPGRVLEIGKGAGLTSSCLKNCGIRVFTMDIDSGLGPDTAGACPDLPFKENSFDLVACFQVLEHLPFEKFEAGLAQIARVSRKWAVMSLPDASRAAALYLKIPGSQALELLLPLPFPRLRHKFDGEHFWEINKKGYGLNRIRQVMENYFFLRRTFRAVENPYHRFFVLEKRA